MSTLKIYSPEVHNHYNNPQNVGSFSKDEENVGIGVVGAPSCGDVMKLSIKVDPKTNVILDAKFKTFGCLSAIASSSYATTQIIGRTLDEAVKLKNTDIAHDLSLPPVKLHCSVLAADAIKQAISSYHDKNSATA